MLDERTGGSACSPVWDESSAAPLALRDVGVSPDTQPCRTGLTFGFRPLRGLLLSAPNASAFLSGMLGFPLIPSPAGLGSRLASGPYGPASFSPERIGLPFRDVGVPPDTQPYRTGLTFGFRPLRACFFRPRTHRPSFILIRCSNRSAAPTAANSSSPSAYPCGDTFSIIDG